MQITRVCAMPMSDLVPASTSMFRVSAMHLMLKRLKPSYVSRPLRYWAAA